MPRLKRWMPIAALVGAPVVCAAFGFVALVQFPALGARTADALRAIAGDEFVAELESVVYGAKDAVDQRRYALGLKSDASPWQDTAEQTGGPVAESTPLPATLIVPVATTAPGAPTTVPAPTVVPFVPRPVQSFANKQGEGQWQPLISGRNGTPLAWRTFLSPDKQRPYVNIGVVAVDLQQARLNIVMGTQEPVSAAKVNRPGRIPDADAAATRLLAAFNGGFKTQHGNFGAGLDGVTLVPPREGFMTVALRKDGQLLMSPWDKALAAKERELSWWRQNGPPILVEGNINPLTANTNAANWGAALDGTVAVWRSALGLSKDGRTLYYAAGDAVVMDAMARALLAAGAYSAMQLDINNHWVHFGVMRWNGDKNTPEPLFPAWNNQEPRRYLGVNARDFFYLVRR